MNKKALKLTFRDTIPVLTGYLFLGIGFGKNSLFGKMTVQNT